jgi:hypothetical protein
MAAWTTPKETAMHAKKTSVKKTPKEKLRSEPLTKPDRDGESATVAPINPPSDDGGKSRGGGKKPPIGSVL